MENGIEVMSNGYEIAFYFEIKVDKEEEQRKLLEEQSRLTNSIERRRKLLSNPGYLAKAPASIVEQERANLAKEEESLRNIKEKLG